MTTSEAPAVTGARQPALAAHRLAAGYGERPVVHNLNLEVFPGEIVALLGSNGAGKSTTVKTLSGQIPPIDGEVHFLGKVTVEPLHWRARRGLSLVSEARSVFSKLSAAENLRVGRCSAEKALATFPELRPLLNRRAGLLSGGEQQMLTLGRALARDPKVLLVDELSLGLAPLVVRRLLRAVREAADNGVAVLLVEQSVNQALRVADRVYVLLRGEVVLHCSADEARARVDEIMGTYLGTGGMAVDEAPVRSNGQGG
jgi:branched-chain amino acid transport system ATP-binding protein